MRKKKRKKQQNVCPFEQTIINVEEEEMKWPQSARIERGVLEELVILIKKMKII
jgi:hypothetical protein